jgi:hypothetical protein
MHHRILLVGTILVFALGAVVLADPPTLSIQQQATLERFQGFPVDVVVTVVVDCGAPAPSEFELTVDVRQGDTIGTSGGVFIPATGGRQVVSLPVFPVSGAFAAGNASASAALVCGALTEGLALGATIKITE